MFPLNHETQGWDSALYVPSAEDPVIKTELDGGYAASRPRHTRTPRKSWKFGWRCTTEANRLLLEAFWNTQRGGSASFPWVDPVTITQAVPAGVTYTVRFKGPIGYQYMGKGDIRLWDITCEVEQV